MDVASSLYSYGDMPPWGQGQDQNKIHGNESYIAKEFPLTDRFETCRVEHVGAESSSSSSSSEGTAAASSVEGERAESAAEAVVSEAVVPTPAVVPEAPAERTPEMIAVETATPDRTTPPPWKLRVYEEEPATRRQPEASPLRTVAVVGALLLLVVGTLRRRRKKRGKSS